MMKKVKFIAGQLTCIENIMLHIICVDILSNCCHDNNYGIFNDVILWQNIQHTLHRLYLTRKIVLKEVVGETGYGDKFIGRVSCGNIVQA